MNYHKLLSKQVKKYLPEALQHDPAVATFLAAISDSYKALDRDKELAERAFTISEDEYSQLNNKLTSEVELRKLSIEKLKEAVSTISGVDKQHESEDLLVIARLLNQQVAKRKNAEQVFTSLISNMQSGVLLEDENRKIVFTNQVFCDLFDITAPPDALQGFDCSDTAEQTKHLFKHPDLFANSIYKILHDRKLVTGEIFELANGDIYQRDYIPIFIDNRYKGHLWSYTDITEKKRNQDTIEQSELKNRLIMNGALDAIITIDTEGLITFWNPQAEKVFGWKADEVMGKKLSAVIIPDAYRENHERGMKHYVATGHGPALSRPMELPAINREGNLFPIELYIVPIRQGNDEFFCSFIRDISERKKNEEELERLSLVASANKNGILFLNLDGTIFWSNEGFTALTLFNTNEVIGKTILELCRGPLTDTSNLKWSVGRFEKREIFNAEIIHYRKDGTWFWGRYLGQPVINKNGKLTHYFLMIEDVSTEKVVQQKLKQYEEHLKIALANVGDNYWEHDFRIGKTYFSNPENNLLGYEIEKMTDIAHLWWSRVHPEDKKILETNDSLYKAGLIQDHHKEYRMIHSDGLIHWVLDRGVVTEKDDEGKPLKIIGTHVDITRQKELELELIVAKEIAEHSTKTKELFLANMSHEIRTPMNAIMGMSNQLNKTALNNDQKFYLNTIQSATENLLIIINDILDLSKIEAGKLTLEKIGFEPKLVVGRAMQVMMHKAEEKGLTFTNSLCDNRLWPVLLGDPYRLNQILLNLISNAIKFTEKGSVDISCNVVYDDELSQTVSVTVSDTGIGMDASFAENLFDKFRQEDESVSRRFGGTGLGMSICKTLVELMDGTIQVHSQKGAGTVVTFNISFEKGVEQHLPVRESMEVDTTILHGKRILMADDNEMNRLVASTILKYYGVVVEEAQNGLDAVEKLQQQPFDLVLMDVQMPVMDGVEATNLIRNELGNQLPIIALTAFAVKGDSQKFIDAGMSDYLSKPFEEHQLLAVTVRWLGKMLSKTPVKHIEVESLPLFDLSAVRSIAKGNEVFVQKMTDLFIEHVPASVREIRAAFLSGDFDRIRKVAHRIKPSIDNLGIVSLKEVTRSMEKNADTMPAEQLESLLHKLETTVLRVVEDLKKRR